MEKINLWVNENTTISGGKLVTSLSAHLNLKYLIQQIDLSNNLPIVSKKQWATEIKERYGSESDFLTTFNPSKQTLSFLLKMFQKS